MIIPSADLFASFDEVTQELLDKLGHALLKPDKKRKHDKTYSNVEAGKLLGISESYIRRLEREKEGFPKVRRTPNGKRLGWTLEDIHKMRDILGYNPSRADTPVRVACANFKGGCGKTTTVIYLAQRAAQHGYRVLLVDLDPQASLTSTFVSEPNSPIPQNATLLPYLEGECAAEDIQPMPSYWPRIDLLPANLELHGAEYILPLRQREEQDKGYRLWALLDNVLAEVESGYDIVLIDTPPSLSYLTLNAVWTAHGMVIPTPAEMLDYISTSLYFRMLSETLFELERANARMEGYSDEDIPENLRKSHAFVRILITKFTGTSSAKEIETWIRMTYRDYVNTNVMLRTAQIESSSGELLTAYDRTLRKSDKTLMRAVENINSVMDEIIERAIRPVWFPEETEKQVEAL
ncbi:hypothetical protein D6833_12650 [Candidatus Parcubacteria bacterium]|nr:MAG: hypothetical protein D6833_12650 [Candidatus Parcubacteria bacterium]